MNEEQADRLIDVLTEIRDVLKPRQEVKVVEQYMRPTSIQALVDFKECVTSNDFWNSLTKEQRTKLLSLNAVRVGLKQ